MDNNRYGVASETICSSNDSHSIIIARLNDIAARTVLDVGCNDGYLGRFLDVAGLELWGVELDPAAGSKAAEIYNKVIIGDATAASTLEQIPDGFFDAAVCGDILEHLVDPWTFIADLKTKLKSGGHVIISVPNLGHCSSLASIGGGNFNYRDIGLHDKTHLRFFSIQSMFELLITAGLTPLAIDRTFHGLFETEIPIPDTISDELIAGLASLPEGRTYQHIYLALNQPPAATAASYQAALTLPTTIAPGLGGQLEALRQQLRETRAELAKKDEQWLTYVGGQLPAAAGEKTERSADGELSRAIYQRIEALAAAGSGRGSGIDPLLPCLHSYDIVIPVFNAPDMLRNCLSALLANTASRHNIIIVDDRSTEPAIETLYEDFAARLTVIRNQVNLGFVGSVNRGLTHSRNDVVILNSDTVVTCGWLERMERCRLARRRTAIVTPLSNRATIYSVPEMNSDNDIPNGWSAQDMADLVAQKSTRLYPLMPTGVGFCMMITRELLDQVGAFDPVFGRGYGEENDLCQRAWQAGYLVACCDDAFVEHLGRASFGNSEAICAARAANEALLGERWPNYHKAVETFCLTNPLRSLQEKIACALRRDKGDERPSVCHLIHSLDTTGGTELHTKNIISGTRSAIRSTAIFPAAVDQWTDISSGFAGDIRVCTINSRICQGSETVNNFYSNIMNDQAETCLMGFLSGNDSQIVHIHHQLNWSSLLLALVAKRAGKKVVYSVHDYHLLCPEFNLLAPGLVRCGKSLIDPEDESCLQCLASHRCTAAGAPATESFAAARRAVSLLTAAAVDIFIAPSATAARHIVNAFGDSVRSKLRIIQHGVKPTTTIKNLAGKGPFRVAFLGNLTSRKGAMILAQAAGILAEKQIQFDIYGGISHDSVDYFGQNVRLHGPYRVSELPQLLAGCDVIIIPSIWDETYCLTLTEAMALGIPPVAARIGALAERVEHSVNGFLYRHDDPADLAETIFWLSQNRHIVTTCAANLRRQKIKTLDENCQEYIEVYRELASQAGSSAFMSLVSTAGQAEGWDGTINQAEPDENWLKESVLAGNQGDITALAKQLAISGKTDEALRVYQDALQHNPAGLAALIGVTVSAILTNKHELALKTARTAASIHAADASALTLYGCCLKNAGEPEAARKMLNCALDIDPLGYDALIHLAGLLESDADTSAYIKRCGSYLQLKPGDNEVRLRLATAYISADDKTAAKDCIDTILALEPENEPAIALARQLGILP